MKFLFIFTLLIQLINVTQLMSEIKDIYDRVNTKEDIKKK